MPKVLILGIDGCRRDALLACPHPAFRQLLAEGTLFANHDILGPRPTTADTVTNPSWTTMLTGVFADRHGVLDNGHTYREQARAPTLFQRVRAVRPNARTAAYVCWPPLETLLFPAPIDHCHVALPEDKDFDLRDADTLRRTVAELRDETPAALFVYLGDVDEVGHQFGFHPTVARYMAALSKTGERVGAILAALQARPRFAAEDWLVLLSTDHGGRGKDHGGCANYPEVRKTFLLCRGGRFKPGVRSERPTTHADVTAAALEHLGVALDPQWRLDGVPPRA